MFEIENLTARLEELERKVKDLEEERRRQRISNDHVFEMIGLEVRDQVWAMEDSLKVYIDTLLQILKS